MESVGTLIIMLPYKHVQCLTSETAAGKNKFSKGAISPYHVPFFVHNTSKQIVITIHHITHYFLVTQCKVCKDTVANEYTE